MPTLTEMNKNTPVTRVNVEAEPWSLYNCSLLTGREKHAHGSEERRSRRKQWWLDTDHVLGTEVLLIVDVSTLGI